jgi:protein O-mannosyl-transferase
MSKKNQQKANTPQPSAKSQPIVIAKQAAPVSKTIVEQVTAITANKYTKIIAGLLVVLIAFGTFYNSRNNQFALDDHGIIKSNKITKAGIGWDNIKKMFVTSHRAGDVSDAEHALYRPFCKVVFAAEWGLGDGTPEFMHKCNIFFFMLCCALLYWLLYLATKGNWILSLAISALFAVHPIHSEVIANIKSLDEILGGIGVLGALICFHYYSKNNNLLLIPLALVSYLIGIFSKESSIVAVGLVPLYLYYFTTADIKKIIIATVTIGIGAAIFLVMREHAVGWFIHGVEKEPSALDNVLALTKVDQTKRGGYQMHLFIPTVIYLMGYYVYTLFYPFPLSCDYSYATVEVKGFGDWEFWVSFLFFISIAYFAIKTIKQKNIIGFGILWFFIAASIVSNLFIVIGTSFGERLMFLPSIGWAIAVVGTIYALFKYAAKFNAADLGIMDGFKKHIALFGILAVVGGIYANKAMDRNKDWFKDFTLFSRDVKYFDNSTHLLFYWGNHLSSSEYHEILKSQGKGEPEIKEANYEAINTFKKSMSIFPALPSDGYNQYGKAYYNLKNIDSADYYYKKAHSEDTTNPVFINNIGTVFFERAIPLKRYDFYDSAYKYFKMASQKDTTMIDYLNNLGAITGTMASLPGQDPIGRRKEAIGYFYNGYKKDSLSEGAILSCRSIAITYAAFGDSVQAKTWTNKGVEINQYRMNKLQTGGF